MRQFKAQRNHLRELVGGRGGREGRGGIRGEGGMEGGGRGRVRKKGRGEVGGEGGGEGGDTSTARTTAHLSGYNGGSSVMGVT